MPPSPPTLRAPPGLRARLTYHDPLDRIWVATAHRLGFRIARTPDAYATTDGAGLILIGTDETLDPDDCLAQMILHELCHALVQGPESARLPDWGLCNTDDRDQPREHACLRLQARLVRPYGLERLLAPTTEYRRFYDTLDADPLGEAGGLTGDVSQRLAREALARASAPPWREPLEQALAATGALLRLVAPFEQVLTRAGHAEAAGRAAAFAATAAAANAAPGTAAPAEAQHRLSLWAWAADPDAAGE